MGELVECQCFNLYNHCDENFVNGNKCKEHKLFIIDMATSNTREKNLNEYMTELDVAETTLDEVPT
jgi:hypothetical protein